MAKGVRCCVLAILRSHTRVQITRNGTDQSTNRPTDRPTDVPLTWSIQLRLICHNFGGTKTVIMMWLFLAYTTTITITTIIILKATTNCRWRFSGQHMSIGWQIKHRWPFSVHSICSNSAFVPYFCLFSFYPLTPSYPRLSVFLFVLHITYCLFVFIYIPLFVFYLLIFIYFLPFPLSPCPLFEFLKCAQIRSPKVQVTGCVSVVNRRSSIIINKPIRRPFKCPRPRNQSTPDLFKNETYFIGVVVLLDKMSSGALSSTFHSRKYLIFGILSLICVVIIIISCR